MSDDPERIDGQEDSEKPERRRIPLILIIIILLVLCLLAGAAAAYAGGLLTPNNPTEEPNTQEPPPTEEQVDSTETFTPIPTTETETFTPTFTDTPTDTSTPTDTPTPTVSLTPTRYRGSAGVGGDGVCCPEETGSCTADCGGGDTGPCANNGGLAWQGEVCVCPGVVDVVTYCQDGSKSDQLTDRTCQPTQDSAPPPPNCAPVVCSCNWMTYIKTCTDACGNTTTTSFASTFVCP